MSILNVDSVSVKYIVGVIDPGSSISVGSVAGSSIGTTVVGQFITSGSGNNNTIIGYQGASFSTLLTTGANNTLLGARTNVLTANTTGGIAIGDTATCSTDSVAIGAGSSVSSTNSISMGFFINSNATNAIAISGSANGTNSIACGSSSTTTGTDSVSLGSQTTTATQSVAIGSNSRCGSSNGLCIGYNSRLANGGGSLSTVIGSSAGSINLQTLNTLVGSQSGTTLAGLGSFYNVCIGTSSGNNLTAASGNVCVGYLSGVATGQGATSASVCVGYQSTLGTVGGPLPIYHLAIGYRAVSSGVGDTYIGPNIGVTLPTGGSGNVIVGLQNGIPVTTASNNIIFGSNSSESLTTGSANILLANGLSALSTGISNVLIGGSGNLITSASNYYGIGSGCWNNITTGSANGGIAIGNGAMTNATNAAADCVGLGLNAGSGVTTGIRNTCIGDSTGASIGIGDSNTCLGYQADIPGFSNCTALGNGANNFTASNQIVLGNGSITNVNAAVVVITNTSDKRDKKDIKSLNVGLDFINKIEPVSFVWNKRDGSRIGDLDIGFIAQHLLEIQKNMNVVIPNLIDETDPEHLMVTPSVLVPLFVKAIKDADNMISVLEKEIALITGKLGI